MGRSTVCGIVKDACEAIWEALHPDFVRMPSNMEEWLGASRQYEQIWNFPNCIGAIDGKYIPGCKGSRNYAKLH